MTRIHSNLHTSIQHKDFIYSQSTTINQAHNEHLSGTIEPPTACRPLTFLPTLDIVPHKLRTGHPRVGLELHLVKDNLSQEVSQQQHYLNTGAKFHRLYFPHMLVPPRK
jgi:hypothetical protein